MNLARWARRDSQSLRCIMYPCVCFQKCHFFFQTWSKFQLLWHLPSQSASKVDLSTVYDKGKNGKLANLKLRNNFLWRHKRPATVLSKWGQFIFITHDTCLIASWWTNQIAMIGLPPACSWGPPDPNFPKRFIPHSCSLFTHSLCGTNTPLLTYSPILNSSFKGFGWLTVEKADEGRRWRWHLTLSGEAQKLKNIF